MDSDQIELIQEQIEAAVDEIIKHHEIKNGKRKIVFERMFNRERDSFQKIHNLPVPPEKFIKQTLVKELLPILGYQYSGEKKVAEKAHPDFLITTTSETILGEVKPPGEIYQAYGQMLRYFDHSEYEYGIITDGLYWEIVKSEESSGIPSGNTLECAELRGVVAEYARENDLVDSSIINLSEDISPSSPEEFYSKFNLNYVNSIL